LLGNGINPNPPRIYDRHQQQKKEKKKWKKKTERKKINRLIWKKMKKRD